MIKKALALALTLALLLSAAPLAAADGGAGDLPFKDVTAGTLDHSAVTYVYESGLFNGVSADEFGPGLCMSRAMFVTVLGRFVALDTDEYTGDSFDDVPAGEYYTPYVLWASQNGVVEGVGDGKFNPHGNITREQMLTVLSRLAETAGRALPDVPEDEAALYPDDGAISDWARAHVYAMRRAGVAERTARAELRPEDAVTRAEVARTMMYFSFFMSDDPSEVLAFDFIQLFADRSLDTAYALMTAEMKAGIDNMGGIEALFETMANVTGGLGAIRSLTFDSELESYRTYHVAIEGKDDVYNIALTIEAGEKVAGMLLLLTGNDAEPRIEMPADFTEEAITVDAGTGYPLPGYAVLPRDTAEKAPAVLLVQGSGASDYDEIMGVNRIFGKLARGLAERGIATLRFTKRTFEYPDVSFEPTFSVKEEYIEDVAAAAELLKQQPGVDPDRVYILGHSLGGMLAPMLVEAGADVAGMILFAGSPRNFMDILNDQQEDLVQYYLDMGAEEMAASYSAQMTVWRAERAALDEMTESEARDPEAGTVYGLSAYYMYVLNNYDALAALKRLALPTLIMQGGNDMQVFADVDYAAYVSGLAGRDFVSFKLYEGLSHGFMPSSATNAMDSITEYSKKMDIPDVVFDDIAAWLESI